MIHADLSASDIATNPALQLQALSSRLNALNEIAATLNQSLAMDPVLNVLRTQVKWLFDFHYSCITLIEKDGSRILHVLHNQGSTSPRGEVVGALVHHISVKKCLQRFDRPALLAILAEEQLPPCTAPYPSWLALPLESETRLVGVLLFAHREIKRYTQDDLRIGHLFALQLANAIRNAQHFSEINQLYEQLEMAYQELQRAEQLRNDMSKMVIHDLRNPLNVVQISLDLLLELINDQSIPLEPHINRALRASQRMQNLIRELLDFNRLETGELPLALRPTDIGSLLLRVADEWRVRANRELRTLSIHLHSALPPISCDAPLIRRVLDNLLNNAFKYTPTRGTIAITAAVDAGYLHIHVRDDGSGIAPENQQRIFDKFVQLPAPNGTIPTEGAGLGLAFCQRVVHAHDGKILVNSIPGGGSTFTLCLPLSCSTSHVA
ncbi:MAG TPA: GAF domain-containing sensor histidine kinase [Caldilineaceae bacterium]|nr:GAF domain-containing sensor histidine kinase [Caldilineaceae bacterium]